MKKALNENLQTLRPCFKKELKKKKKNIMRHLMTSTYYFYSNGNGIQTEMNKTEIVHKLNRHSLNHLFYHECYRK